MSTGGWDAQDRMSERETFLWRGERHPQRSATVAVLMMLDSVPDRNRLRAAHEWVTELVPRARQRVREAAVPVEPPAWVPDPTFDLDYHLRRVSLPAPGGPAELLAFAQSAAMTPFDRTRPLWEGTLIEGLPDGKAAYFLKLHRALTDGPGGVPLVSLTRNGHRASIRPDGRSPAAGELAGRVLTLPAATAKLVTTGAQALTRPGPTAASALRFAGSLRRTTPWSAPGSPLLHRRTGTSWRFHVLEFPLAGLEAAAEAAGGSTSDAYVAALLGGMRRYHERHDADLDELVMTMPVGRHQPAGRPSADGWAGTTFRVPAGMRDPAERIATIRGITLSLRAEPALNAMAAIVPVLNRVPVAVRGAIGRLSASADLSASIFPGTPGATRLAGAKVERTYPFGALPGTAVTAVMVPYAGTCCVGTTIDSTAVPDPEVLVECMREGLDEVLGLRHVLQEQT